MVGREAGFASFLIVCRLTFSPDVILPRCDLPAGLLEELGGWLLQVES